MSEEEHNGPGFYYVVRWRRHDLAPSAKFEERPVDSKSSVAVIDGQSVYKPYEIYVLAVNDAGDAVSPPLMHIGYSSEDGCHSSLSVCPAVSVSVCVLIGNHIPKSTICGRVRLPEVPGIAFGNH